MSKKVVKKVIITSLIVIALLIVATMLFLSISYSRAKLSIDALTNVNTGVKLYSSNYLEEDESYSYNLNRKIVNIEELSPNTINAFIAIEDKRFYNHNGYDLKRIAKSALVNLKEGDKKQGASTITQQLVKNTLLSNEKTYKRKINEVMLAIKVEKEFTKQEIMNMYLNTIYFGSNAYGIENASQIYFNKSAVDLNLNESAILAGIIKSPTTYSPKLNPENCFKRKNLVLKQMLENNFISSEEYDNNVKQDVSCSNYVNSYDNSYYQQAILEACKLLDISEKELIRNDYSIITFMDNELQSKIKELYENLNYAGDKLSIVANSDGQILAFIGNSVYDLSKMSRSPASTIKPFAVYLPLIEHNIIYPCTPILDEEINFDNYSPKNFDNQFHGWVSAKASLAQSLNIPAVKLLNVLTVDKSIDFLNKLGLNLKEEDHNLSLALGGLTNGLSPKKLLEMYTVLQNSGNYTKLRFVDKILDSNGHIVYDNKLTKNNICSEESAYLLTDMLKETVNSGSAKNLRDLGYEIASKTGTNSVDGNIIDLYNIAYTSDISILTWIGDAKNIGLEDISTSFEATNLNKEILKKIYVTNKPKDFYKPEGIVKLPIDLVEYNHNHRIILAGVDTPERYTKYELFNTNYTPIQDNSIYQTPNLDMELDLSTTGLTINYNLNPLFDYSLEKTADNQLTTFAINTNLNSFKDEKVFCYSKISYRLIAKHKYNDKIYYSLVYDIYPKDYLLSYAKKQERLYNITTKDRWYV